MTDHGCVFESKIEKSAKRRELISRQRNLKATTDEKSKQEEGVSQEEGDKEKSLINPNEPNPVDRFPCNFCNVSFPSLNSLIKFIN